ncbi:olfactory receptor 14J1-like [Ornithorhynchus anatinus]|uniref:G-protein coupled receptors family 1 profile domain-containing protein n=1 Tax=Ornithorhynchus anatinus TaxID=9258 RepID=A0A6I8PIT1_ORNAN|nr:olfactory receptor 14J1-like [Ornithorhynchus anatinus]
MGSGTAVTEFLLLGFSEVQELQLFHAALFLLLYLVALMGNLLIVAITALDQRLHTPMYFFLRNLSVLDLCLISAIVPKSILNSLTNNRSISFPGCILQVFFFGFAASSEMALLTAMFHHRYVAICCPLSYDIIMHPKACGKMVAASWLSGALNGLLHTAASFSSPFCGSKVINQFFCDIPPLLRLSCSRGFHSELGVIAFNVLIGSSCFASITLSYVRIFSAVLRMRSTSGRAKAFSTCLPHLAVVTLFVSPALLEYSTFISKPPSILDLVGSLFYTVVPPTLNPLIYSLRNRDVKTAVRKLVCRSKTI